MMRGGGVTTLNKTSVMADRPERSAGMPAIQEHHVEILKTRESVAMDSRDAFRLRSMPPGHDR